IVSAVLGSLGFSNIGTGNDGVEVARERGQQRMTAASGIVDTLQPEQARMRGHLTDPKATFGLPTGVSMGAPHPPLGRATMTARLGQAPVRSFPGFSHGILSFLLSGTD
ncbi:hypothetical protein Tsubulata_027174, partial [Turnera subulata]